MSYWQGPEPWHDGNLVETGNPRKDSRTVATAEDSEIAAEIVSALNLIEQIREPLLYVVSAEEGRIAMEPGLAPAFIEAIAALRAALNKLPDA